MLLSLGQTFYHLQNYEGAIDVYKEASKQKMATFEVFSILAQLYKVFRRYE